MNQRIKELRKALGLTLEKFGERLGVSRAAMSNLENGNRNVTEQMVKSICREFNVSEEWLRSGIGDMFIPLSHQEELMKAAANLLKKKDSPFSEGIKAFLITYDQLEDSEKQVLDGFYQKYLTNIKKF